MVISIRFSRSYKKKTGEEAYFKEFREILQRDSSERFLIEIRQRDSREILQRYSSYRFERDSSERFLIKILQRDSS
jgi:hypothetical protein